MAQNDAHCHNSRVNARCVAYYDPWLLHKKHAEACVQNSAPQENKQA